MVGLGLDVHAVTAAGDTALHAAVTGRGSQEIIRVLLELGADPRAANMKEQTPLTLAAARSTPEIVGLLEQAAAQRDGD
jgi:ankyrin repeat protein